jgi:hypothetical protein
VQVVSTGAGFYCGQRALEPLPSPQHHLGTIQGVTLPVQLVGQALEPVTAGFVFDVTRAYHHTSLGFAGIVLLGSACVLTATPSHSSEAL